MVEEIHEMSLEEYVAVLPKFHRARREYESLLRLEHDVPGYGREPRLSDEEVWLRVYLKAMEQLEISNSGYGQERTAGNALAAFRERFRKEVSEKFDPRRIDTAGMTEDPMYNKKEELCEE